MILKSNYPDRATPQFPAMRNVLYLLLSVFIFSCDFDQPDDIISIEVTKDLVPLADDLITQLNTYKVPVDASAVLDIEGIQRVEKAGDYLTFLMNTPHGQQVFSLSGHEVLTTVGRIGDGPGEYRKVVDFYIREDRIAILSELGYVMEFTHSGDVLGMRDSPIPLANSFAPIAGGNIFYSNAGNLDRPYRLWWVSAADNTPKHEALSFDPEKSRIPITGGPAFWEAQGYVTFCEPFSNVAYRIFPQRIDTAYVLDFGRYAFEEDIYHADAMSAIMRYMDRGFFTLRRFLESSDGKWSYFFLEKQASDGSVSPLNLFYHRPSGQVYTLPDDAPYRHGAYTTTAEGGWIFPVLRWQTAAQAEILTFEEVHLQEPRK